MREPTAYEETIVENEAILPSFTLCPLNHHDSVVKSIESFNDVTQAIENTKFKYTITITKNKAFEEAKKTTEIFNNASNGVMYYAPKTSIEHPFETVICLIWAPNLQNELEQDWSVSVCIKDFFLSSKL